MDENENSEWPGWWPTAPERDRATLLANGETEATQTGYELMAGDKRIEHARGRWVGFRILT